MDEKIIKEYFLEDDPSFEIVKIEKMQHLERRYYKVFSKDEIVEVFIDDNDNVQILPEYMIRWKDIIIFDDTEEDDSKYIG